MIKFSLGQLEHQHRVEICGEEPVEFLQLDDLKMYDVIAPVTYNLEAKLIPGGVLVSGSVETTVHGICGRCLAEMDQVVVNDDVCLFYEDINVQEIDITDDVRAEMVVELPMNLICSDDCRGLCQTCGINLNLQSCECQQPKDGNSAWSQLDNLDI